jgi:ABC-2 type transport system ATP-binding protein
VTEALLEARDLRLRYAGGVQALDGVSFDLGAELVGLLGPNGAGKTTLLSVLARRLRHQQGSARLLGVSLEKPKDRMAWLRQVSYLPQEEGPPDMLSGREVVELALALARPEWSRERQRRAAANALERVGLAKVANRRAAGYSGGMRRRLGLARALAPAPALLLVDEPTSGLDPDERVSFRDLLCDLADVSAVIVSTHIAADVEVSCSRVIVFNVGRVIWDGKPAAMMAASVGRVFAATLDEEEAAALAQKCRVTSMVRQESGLSVRYLAARPAGNTDVACSPTMEEAYVDLVNRYQQVRTEEEP